MRGTRALSIKFIDRNKPQESWAFSSTTRKLTRSSTAQREATQGGGDASSDDNMGYDDAIPTMKYKYLGRKELLIPRHQEIKQLKKWRKEGDCLFSGIQRERINMYVVECIHKKPNYLYSKQIWYIDPETWQMLYADKYDRQGRLWRIFGHGECVVKSVYNDALIGVTRFISIVDIKRFHATGGVTKNTIGETGENYQPEYYTPKALQKWGY
jgi:hypothetical protein